MLKKRWPTLETILGTGWYSQHFFLPDYCKEQKTDRLQRGIKSYVRRDNHLVFYFIFIAQKIFLTIPLKCILERPTGQHLLVVSLKK